MPQRSARMPVSPADASAPVPTDVKEIERALMRISHLLTRARQHDRLMTAAGVPADRAAVPVLRLLAESSPLRPGEIAAHLGVEAAHVTRQLQRLQAASYVERVADPDDRRSHLVQLTPAGRDAAACIREAGQRQVQEALSAWTPEELQQLATLVHRMVDDFLDYTAICEPAHLRTP